MPEGAEPTDAEVEAIAQAVEAGSDDIAVPQELIDEPDGQKPPPEAKSLYAEILNMAIGPKIKLALRGNKDARTILIRDTNKMIRRFVLHNPRISDGEVISVCRNRSADEELLRIVNGNKEWIRNYQVKLALVQNPRTPLPIAVKHVPTLDERDIRFLARSKNVSATVSAQCRRILFSREKHD